MSLVPQIITLLLLVTVFRIACLFTTSTDWRNSTLGWIVLIVYIFIGIRYALRMSKRG